MGSKTLDIQIFESFSMLQNNEKQFILLVIKSYLKKKETTTQQISGEQFDNKLQDVVAHMKTGKSFTMEEMEAMANNW